MISIAHSCQSLQYEVDREDIDWFEVLFVETVRIDPTKLVILTKVVVKATQETPEAGKEMSCEEYEQKEGNQVYVVTHFHYVVASRQQKFVHKGWKEAEETIRMHKSC